MSGNALSFVYPDKRQALLGTLVESCLALEGVEYLVGGGWAPYLRVSGHTLTHPGTWDVDLLFRHEQKDIQEAAKRLGAVGYLPAAKTPHMRYKPLSVGNRRFVFNVDLLFLQREEVRTLFDEKLWSPFEIEATVPGGEAKRASIPLIDETAVVMLKSSAMWEMTKANKRSRDAFDVFYVLSAPCGRQVASRFKALGSTSRMAARSFSRLATLVREHADGFNKQVRPYCRENEVADPAGQIAALLATV